ncbi:MAG: hypothetical protein ACLFWG_06725 [Longimicrobiales bacterium]
MDSVDQEESETPERESESAEVSSESQDELRGGGNHGRPADRLPPPAFPPGARRRSIRRRAVTESPGSPAPTGSERAGPEFPRDALISPDEPIRKKGRGIPDEAFISPDDPLVPVVRDQEGQVTGMSVLTSSRAESGPGRSVKPTVHELPYLLGQLAENLQESGEKALEVRSDMGHFQAALRSFLKGYLEGSRD